MGAAKSAGSHGVVQAGVASPAWADSEGASGNGFKYGAGLVTVTVGNVGMTSLIEGTIGLASLSAAIAAVGRLRHETRTRTVRRALLGMGNGRRTKEVRALAARGRGATRNP